LEERDGYYKDIVRFFSGEFKLQDGVKQFENEIKRFVIFANLPKTFPF